MLNLSDVSSGCVLALKKMFTPPDWNVALKRIRSGKFRKKTTFSLSVLGQGHQCISRYTATTVKEQQA